MNINDTPAIRSLDAIASFGNTQDTEKAYLKVMYDHNGEPYLKCIKESLSFWDTLHWFFVPKAWNRFNLNKVSDICRKIISDDKSKAVFNLDHFNGVVQLNSKIRSHNRAVDHAIIKVFQYRINRVIVPLDLESKVLNIDSNPRVITTGAGIKNVGNTCYQNALIQAFRKSKAFRDGFEFPHLKRVFNQLESQDVPLKGDSKLMESFRSWISSDTIGFKRAFDGTQEDVHELLTQILADSNKIFSIKDKYSIAPRPVQNSTLLLNMEGIDASKETSVQEIITGLKTELSQSDAPSFLPITVGRFRTKTETEKYKEPSYLPPFFVERTREVVKVEKLHVPILPDKEITIPCSDGPSVKYKLRSVILHSGESPRSGHYFTHAPAEQDSWIEYNDSSVTTKMSADCIEQLKKEGYVYFYDKVD